VIRIFVGVMAVAIPIAADRDAAPGAGDDWAAQFPVNQWVSLDGVLKLDLMPGAEAQCRFMNWYGGGARRSKTGEVIALDGFVGHESQDAGVDGEPVGAKNIYSNSLYGVAPAAGLMRQYDAKRRIIVLARHVQRNGPHGLAIRLDFDVSPERRTFSPPSD
jgi:hypothetical protein